MSAVCPTYTDRMTEYGMILTFYGYCGLKKVKTRPALRIIIVQVDIYDQLINIFSLDGPIHL